MTDTLHTPPERPARTPAFLPIVFAYRRTLAIGALVGLLVGVTAALLKPTTYTASATLLFPSAPASGLAALTSGSGGDLSGIPLLQGALVVPRPGTSPTTARILLQSRTARREVLAALQEQGVDLQQAWKLDSTQQTLDRLKKGMRCVMGKQGDLQIEFCDTDGVRAQQIASALVSELGSLSESLGLEPAQRSIKFLEAQQAKAEAAYGASQRALQDFQKTHLIVSLPEQSRALAERYARLQSDAVAAQLEADVALRQVDVLSEQAKALIAACTDPAPGAGQTLAPLYKQVTQTESELALLRSQMTDDHPDVQAKRLVLAEARRLLKEEIQRQMSMLQSGSAPAVNAAVVQATVNRAKASGLGTALDAAKSDVAKLPSQQAEYAWLAAELEANLTEMKLYRQELEKARIIAQSRGPLFVVVDAPDHAERDPAGRLSLVALAIFLGLGFAALLPYREWFRRQLAADMAGSPARGEDG